MANDINKIKKIGDKQISVDWKNIDNIPESVGKDTIISNGIGEYSIIGGRDSNAIGDFSIAIGDSVSAGVKGYYYGNISFGDEISVDGKSTGDYGPCEITLVKEQPNDFSQVVLPESFNINFRVGDSISIVNNDKYVRCAIITAINQNIITVDSLPFNTVKNAAGDVGRDDYTIFCPDNVLGGEINFGYGATAYGDGSIALEWGANAEGRDTKAEGQYSHAEGRLTVAYYASHAEGRETKAIGQYSHAEGQKTLASGSNAHAEGKNTEAIASAAHAEGQQTHANGNNSHAEGLYSTSAGEVSHAEGQATAAKGNQSHAEGYTSQAEGVASHAEGYGSISIGIASHAEGGKDNDNNIAAPVAEGDYSHAEGLGSKSSGRASHAEGSATAQGIKSHAEGSSIAVGQNAHSEGYGSQANGNYSHAENKAIANGEYAHAENNATAQGYMSHAEGDKTQAMGSGSHAEGNTTIANASYTHVEGRETIASSSYQHVQGRWNVEDKSDTYAHIVGNGTWSTKRRNIHSLDWNGNGRYQGDLYVHSVESTVPGEANYAGDKVATETYVNEQISNISGMSVQVVSFIMTAENWENNIYYGIENLYSGDLYNVEIFFDGQNGTKSKKTVYDKMELTGSYENNLLYKYGSISPEEENILISGIPLILKVVSK